VSEKGTAPLTEAKQKMLTMPADYRVETLDRYAELNSQYPHLAVRETYGNLNPSPIELSTGRSAKGLPEISLAALKEYAAHGNRLGIHFNYTINTPCTGNLEFSSRGRKKFLGFVEQLLEAGIEHMTLASPSLIQLVKGHFPKMDITVSTIAQVDSVPAAKGFEEMGASRIVVAEDINRQFYVLRMIRRHINIPLEIIVNTRCFYSCPYRAMDYNLLGHLGGDSQAPDVRDYYKWICTGYLLSSPLEWMKMRWIRPEDLGLYGDITWFKVIGRHLVDRCDLPRAARSYMEGRFDGNLLDLLGNFSNERATLYPVAIDNRALDGFAAWYAKNPFNCAEQGCDGCNHCEEYLKKAVDPASLENLGSHVQRYKGLLEDVHHRGWTRSIPPDEILLQTYSMQEAL
jgi:collagenase-like PrtC family protease